MSEQDSHPMNESVELADQLETAAKMLAKFRLELEDAVKGVAHWEALDFILDNASRVASILRALPEAQKKFTSVVHQHMETMEAQAKMVDPGHTRLRHLAQLGARQEYRMEALEAGVLAIQEMLKEDLRTRVAPKAVEDLRPDPQQLRKLLRAVIDRVITIVPVESQDGETLLAYVTPNPSFVGLREGKFFNDYFDAVVNGVLNNNLPAPDKDASTAVRDAVLAYAKHTLKVRRDPFDNGSQGGVVVVAADRDPLNNWVKTEAEAQQLIVDDVENFLKEYK